MRERAARSPRSLPPRVLIVDDHRMFAEGLEKLLVMEAGVEVLGTVGTAAEALQLCRRVCPDVVVMDLDLPGMNGAEAPARLRALCPDARVVAVGGVQDRELIARAVQAGISGFVPKTGPAEELVGLIRAVAEDPGDLAILVPPGSARSWRRWRRGSPRPRWPSACSSAPGP
jgi:DNA-binding NarL/FixJ family response regulator